MSTINQPCAKCNQIQPLVLCFNCIDKRNTELSSFKSLPSTIPIKTINNLPTLEPMNDGFMPLDVVAIIARHAVNLPLEPHETIESRHTRMSLICKRARSVISPMAKPPPLTDTQRNRLHHIFYKSKRSNRDRAEWSVDRFLSWTWTWNTKILGLILHRAYIVFSWYWITMDSRILRHIWLCHILQLSKSCLRIKCHTQETVHH